MLLGKFAPNTFSVIIDNSGFVNVDLKYLVGSEIDKVEISMTHDKELITFPFVTKNPWTIKDDKSASYLSESCQSIRSLLEEDHMVYSDTEYHIFHSVKDTVVPVGLKDNFISILTKKSIPYYYQKVEPHEVDGRIFKDLGHGMKASMRGIFDLVAERRKGNFNKNTENNDFDLRSVNVFNCFEKSYAFRFDKDYNINVEIKSIK